MGISIISRDQWVYWVLKSILSKIARRTLFDLIITRFFFKYYLLGTNEKVGSQMLLGCQVSGKKNAIPGGYRNCLRVDSHARHEYEAKVIIQY